MTDPVTLLVDRAAGRLLRVPVSEAIA